MYCDAVLHLLNPAAASAPGEGMPSVSTAAVSAQTGTYSLGAGGQCMGPRLRLLLFCCACCAEGSTRALGRLGGDALALLGVLLGVLARADCGRFAAYA